ncbi:response regulator [Shewanella sp. GutDb-MelDb]|uniref:response regulator n=1 Tax=Shewanella sp. GutDb-MelDb TaxID=2058316 RepID=UPI000C7BD48D|nr:response regulator [Shewanella sp. GutDb-MelDb]PKG59054.1 hypothetical protein CXF82_01295 [Shewanella sp. GutDb-MelDb]
MNINNVHVLIADDSPLILSSLKFALRSMGFRDENTFTCKNALQAIIIIESNNIDLLISDLNFGTGTDGIQLVEHIRAKGLFNDNNSIIILTGDTRTSTVLSIIDNQPDDYIVKPYKTKDLEYRINKTLRRKKILNKINHLPSNMSLEQKIFVCDEHISKYTELSNHIDRIKCNYLIQEKQFESAKNIFNKALKIYNEDWPVRGMLKVLSEQNKNIDLELFINSVKDKDSAIIKMLCYEASANLHICSGHFKEAASLLSKCVDIVNNNSERWLLLGQLHFLNCNFHESSEAFKQSMILIEGTHKDNSSIHYYYLRSKFMKANISATELRSATQILNRFNKKT